MAAKRYRAAHKPQLREKDARYRQTEEGRASARRRAATYAQSQQGKVNKRVTESRRRARRKNAVGQFSHDDFALLVQRQTRCHLCGKRFTKADPPTIDHIIPIALGGDHDKANIALAHKGCNSQKHKQRTHLI